MAGNDKHLDTQRLNAFAGRVACEQVGQFSRMWPSGIGVPSHQSQPSVKRDADFATFLKIARAARERGLDLTYAACSIAVPEHLGPFIMFTLQQRLRLLGIVSPQPAARIMADEPRNSGRYRLAASILRDLGTKPTGHAAYGAALAARKGALAVDGKIAFKRVSDEQSGFWVEWIRKARDGELLPLPGEEGV